MNKLLTFALAGIVGLSASAQDGEPMVSALDVRPAIDLQLADFLWANRLIVVFADTELDPAFQKQIALLLEHPNDLIVRDVIVITDTNPATPSAIRRKLRPRGFGLVLVDKDGLVKLRKPAPWDVREISRSIDKTELRRQEVRDRLEN